MKTIQSFVLVLSTGYIFFYFSELLFWARPRPDDSLPNWIDTWLAYSVMAFVFLTLLSNFWVRELWGLFLAGAAFGWIAEGLVVQTAYEMLPLSLSFTGLAWHALITVWIGWYAIRRSLASPSPGSTLMLSCLIGLAYGLWAISWWLEPDGGTATAPEFAAYSFAATLPLILAYRLSDWSATPLFAPRRWVVLVIAAIFAVYFVFVTVPAVPISAILLPAILALVYLGLRWQQTNTVTPPLLESLSCQNPTWKSLTLLAIPAVGTLVYALALSMNLHIQTNLVLYLITTPLGFIYLGYSLYRSWRVRAAERARLTSPS